MTDIDDHKNLAITLNLLEQKLIDGELNKKLAVLPNISYTELQKLLVTAKPELLGQQIDYTDDDIITGKRIEAETMEFLLNAPNHIDIWKTLHKTIAQHNDKEKGRYPINFNPLFD